MSHVQKEGGATIKCPLCGSGEIEEVFIRNIDGNLSYIGKGDCSMLTDKIYMCKKCGVLFIKEGEK